MQRIKLALWSLAGGLAFAATSQAATITMSFSNPLSTAEIDQSGTLGLFDTALGTLNGASLSLNGSAVMALSIENSSAQTQNARAIATTDLYFSSTLAAIDTLLPAAEAIRLRTDTGLLAYAAGATRSFGPLPLSGALTLDLASILGNLGTTGGGNFGLGCTSLSGLSISGGGGNLSTRQSTTAACGGSVTYTYTPAQPTNVPEPGTLALLGVGLAGLGLTSRRRRA